MTEQTPLERPVESALGGAQAENGEAPVPNLPTGGRWLYICFCVDCDAQFYGRKYDVRCDQCAQKPNVSNE